MPCGFANHNCNTVLDSEQEHFSLQEQLVSGKSCFTIQIKTWKYIQKELTKHPCILICQVSCSLHILDTIKAWFLLLHHNQEIYV